MLMPNVVRDIIYGMEEGTLHSDIARHENWCLSISKTEKSMT